MTKPTILTIFGATGDLMTKKIIPAIYMLYLENKLPEPFEIIGFSRRPYDDELFRNHVKEIIENFDKDFEPNKVAGLLKKITFVSSFFDDVSGYKKLEKAIAKYKNPNLLFYLSVAPNFYGLIVENLSQIKKFTKAKILVEKPIGSDYKTGKTINKTLSKYFDESQIYRTDHYLHKNIVRNIFAFRFFNNMFKDTWNKDHIEKIEITTNEEIGVENRANFYDPIGALRDVGQNHILEMLSLLIMNQPKEFTAEEIIQSRANVMNDLIVKNLKKDTFRAQYKTYNLIEGVDHSTKTETYFKIKAEVNNTDWKNIPIFIEAGKKVSPAKKEIVVTFKPISKALIKNFQVNQTINRVVFSLSSNEIQVYFTLFNEEPKEEMVCFIKEGKSKKQYVNEYMNVILEAIDGSKTWFVGISEVDASWKFIDKIEEYWKTSNTVLNIYKPETDDVTRLSNKFFQS